MTAILEDRLANRFLLTDKPYVAGSWIGVDSSKTFPKRAGLD
jgi:hypothetical protein